MADIPELIFDPPQSNGVPIGEQSGQQVYFCQFNKTSVINADAILVCNQHEHKIMPLSNYELANLPV
jgi:hypothetical protein